MDYKTKKTNELVTITAITDEVVLLKQRTFDKFSGEETEPIFNQVSLQKLYEERDELQALLKDKLDLIKDVEALSTKVDKTPVN